MKKIIFPLVIFFIIVLFAAGCRPSLVVQERPVPPRYERPVAPGPGRVWVSGEWVRSRGTYVYRNGYWARQYPGHMYYISGHWQDKKRGWVWRSGHWR